MKKLISLGLLILMSFSIVACNNNDNDNSQSRNIVLTYADWANQEFNQVMIDAFMERYPHITVELRRDITGSGGEFTANLLNAQAAGVLPDVFAIDNVPTGISNGMLLDIAELWDNDPDTALVYPNIARTALYQGRRYAMPSFQFLKGIYINLTLLDFYNIPIPPKDWKYQDMVDLAIQIRQAGQNDAVYGIEPWFGDLDFHDIWPTQDHVDVGQKTFDGTRFNFTSQSWIDAYYARLDLYARNVVTNFSEDELEIVGDGWGWLNGFVGMNIDGSWNLWMVQRMFEEQGMEIGFWPYPGGAAGQFPPTILDFTVVSSQTENPEEAYLLAKWMSWGREGWQARLDRLTTSGDPYLDRFPIADYPEIWDRIDVHLDYVEGLREIIDLMEFAKPDISKWLYGYKEFREWINLNDYGTRIAEGLISPEVLAAEWEEKANEFISQGLSGE